MLTFAEACKKAQEKSKQDDCTKHVCALLGFDRALGVPVVRGYRLDDWYDGTTVKSYTSGVEH